ncbi:MAG TPA: glycosyltransferase family 2 protein [Rhodanobacteraceae bacterium]|nr:glycosyltransferase family 2 protein [Rhodanobacteraceae bacterium]
MNDAVARRSGLTSVVVVAADSGPLLLTAIEAALASSVPVEVLLVDNASSDGAPHRAMAVHAGDARLRLLRQPDNIGFGPACNRAAAVAAGDALLILNPDCTIEPGTIGALRAIAARQPKTGILGVEVVSPDGEPARGNRRREPTLRRALMTMSGLSRLEGRWPSLAGVEMPPRPDAPAVEPVEAVSGACLFVPRAVFDVVGGFDEAYFLHVEDLDLCRRVRDAGHVVAIAHALRAVHAQGGSSRHRPLFVSRHKHRGMWRYFTRFDPAAKNPLVRGLVWLGIWAHFALTAPFRLARRANPRNDDGAFGHAS